MTRLRNGSVQLNETTIGGESRGTGTAQPSAKKRHVRLLSQLVLITDPEIVNLYSIDAASVICYNYEF